MANDTEVTQPVETPPAPTPEPTPAPRADMESEPTWSQSLRQEIAAIPEKIAAMFPKAPEQEQPAEQEQEPEPELELVEPEAPPKTKRELRTRRLW